MSGSDATAAGRAAPDIFLVVLDTARKDFLSGGSSPAPGQPFMDGLRAQSWVHDRTIAPAPWTAPSHASLFTGEPPWRHRLHLKGLARLDPSFSTLGETLRGLGYRTASFTVNNFVGPLTGLQRGFDEWWVGGKQDWLLRGFRGPPTETSRPGPGSRFARLLHFGLQEPMWSYLARWPGPVDKVAPLLARGPRGLARQRVAPWVEPELRRWLASVPSQTPTFAFVNLMEPHEPYFGITSEPGGAEGPGLRGAPRQDSRNWATGTWSPTDEEIDRMRRAYRETFRVVDDRLRGLVEILRAAGRWENSLFVLTSDHGQAFGEDGVLFHGIRTAESLLRVPLWIRAPRGASVPLPTSGWLSLTSVRPAIEEIARAVGQGRPEMLAAPEPGASELSAVAVADGLGGAVRSHVPAERLAVLDRLEVAGYQGTKKLRMDVATERCTVVDLERDPAERAPTSVEPSGELEGLSRTLREAARQAFATTGGPGESVEDRLGSWGYV